MFVRVSSSPARLMLPNPIAKKASTVLDVGDVVIATSGQVDVAVGSSLTLLGLNVQKVAATDSDYASTTAIPVEQIDPNAVYLIDVSTGSATAANIGGDYDLANEYSITLSGTTYKQIHVVGVVSATQVLGKFNTAVCTF